MKVILSIDSIKYPLTGIGRYSFELARQLQLQNQLQLMLYANGRFLEDLPVSGQFETNKLNWAKQKLRKNNLIVKTYQLFSQYKHYRALRNHHDAVFHGPSYYLPKFTGLSVATFHDLSIFTHSQYHPTERVRFMQKELMLTIQQASMLITDSEYTRQELASYFNYPLDKVRSVHLACSGDFYPRESVDTTGVLSRFGLTHGNYTLYAGTIEPRKNIETLLDAYSKLPKQLRQKWPLVLAGYHGWQSEQLHERIQAAQDAGWVRYLGYVANEDLPFLFSGAKLFLFPSHYEGFGLPVLEAMASGVPVICSNTSSLPEVAGNSALMFEPTDVDTLNQFILKGLEDDKWRSNAKDIGITHSAKFSWERCAQETIAVYREL